MLYPSINLLRTKVDSKYTLVAMASKRARDIIDGKPVLVDDPAINKPVSIATEEIAEDKITYSRSFETEQEALEIEHEHYMDAHHAAELAAAARAEQLAEDEADGEAESFFETSAEPAEDYAEAEYTDARSRRIKQIEELKAEE